MAVAAPNDTNFDSRGILIADDDDNDVLLIKRAFYKAGMVNPLIVLRNGEQVVDYFQGVGSQKEGIGALPLFPALVLLDIKMPRKGGFEVLSWIRQKRELNSLAIVMLTSSRESSDVNKAYSLGANAYLVKPTNFIRLVDMVNRLQEFYKFTQQDFVLDFSLQAPDRMSEIGMVRF